MEPTATSPLPDPAAEAIAQRAAALVIAAFAGVSPRMAGENAGQTPAAQQRGTGDHTAAILTRPEARAYVKRHSEAAFCDWCKRWGIRAASRGRYSRLALDRALEREARAGRRVAA